MTGPKHYREAEKFLSEARSADTGSDLERYLLTSAQVHATLALAAATALKSAYEFTIPDHDAWMAAASNYKRPEASA